MITAEHSHIPTDDNLQAKPVTLEKVLFSEKGEEWEQVRPCKWSESII